MATSITDWNHPCYEPLNELAWKERPDYFLEKPGRMEYVSLGEALDFISTGLMNCVAYPFSEKKVIKFIDSWINNQELKEENSYAWNRNKHNHDEELPFIKINHDSCPRDKNHTEIMTQRDGTVRCGHIMERKIVNLGYTQNFRVFDSKSQIEKIFSKDMAPEDPLGKVPSGYLDGFGNDEEGKSMVDWTHSEYQNFILEKEKYEAGKTQEIIDPCYAIIKMNEERYLSLQTVIERLDIPRVRNYSNPFSGFTLANYVKSWWQQPGRKKVWRNPNERNEYRMFKDFQPISSND